MYFTVKEETEFKRDYESIALLVALSGSAKAVLL